MSERAFRWSLMLLAGSVLLSGTTFPGLLIGLFFAFSIAFFAAPIAFLVAGALHRAGLSLSWRAMLAILASLYALATVSLAVRAWMHWRGARFADARLATVQAGLLAALPLIAYLSSQALVRAWR